MKRATWLTSFILLPILLLIMAGCGSQSVEEATQDFCQSLVAYSEALTAFENISARSTVKELNDARKGELRARDTVRAAARNLREAKLDAIDQAWKDLDKIARQISNQDTLAQAAVELKLGLANVRAAYGQLGLDNCPDLFPAAAAGPAAPAPAQPITPTQPITATQPVTTTQPITATQPVTITQPITGTQPITATPAAMLPVTATVTSTTTTAMPAGPAPVGTPSLTGVVWQLQAIQLTSGATLTPSDPALYSLTLQPDGTASVVADCFTGAGTYTVSGDKISFTLRYTGTMCPPPSLASQYATYLDYTTQYALADGTLTLTYSGTGKITFTPTSP